MTRPHRSFYFIRHGQTDWNVEGRMQGHTDIPLNQTGIDQAHQAAELLEKIEFDLIVSSPLSRAYQTAAIIAKRKGLEIISEPLLKERHFGKFEGKTVEEVHEALGLEKGSSISWHLPPCAEQWPETKARSLKIVSEYLTALKNGFYSFHMVRFSGLFMKGCLQNGAMPRMQNRIIFILMTISDGR